MSARLTSAFRVTALLRRVHDAGGSAVLLARGDAHAGAILAIATERGTNARAYERGIGPDGATMLIRAGSDADDTTMTRYWQKRVACDPDLWVVELDVAGAERFAAETILDD